MTVPLHTVPRGRPPPLQPVTSWVAGAKEPIDWMVHNVLPTNALVILAGEPKRGMKSLSCMRLGLSVARGEPFLSQTVRCKRPVVYSFLEDGPKRVGQRFRALGVTEDEDLKNYFAGIGEEGLGDRGLDSMLDRVAASKQPMLWCLDPFVELEALVGIESENDPIAVAKLLKRIRGAVQESGSTALIVHHFRKDNEKMRGSTALNGACDGWIDVRHRGQNLTLWEFTLRDALPEPIGCEMVVTGSEEDPRFTFVARAADDMPKQSGRGRGGGSSSEPTADSLRKVLEAVHTAPARLWTQRDLAERSGVHRNTIGRVLDKLDAEGKVVKDGKGWRLYVPERGVMPGDGVGGVG